MVNAFKEAGRVYVENNKEHLSLDGVVRKSLGTANVGEVLPWTWFNIYIFNDTRECNPDHFKSRSFGRRAFILVFFQGLSKEYSGYFKGRFYFIIRKDFPIWALHPYINGPCKAMELQDNGNDRANHRFSAGRVVKEVAWEGFLLSKEIPCNSELHWSDMITTG